MFKDSVAGNIAKLASGSILAQILYLLSLPYITRIYPSEYWGLLAIVVSTSMIISSFNTLQLETLLVLKHKEFNPHKITEIVFINIGITLLVLIVISIGVIVNEVLFLANIDFKLIYLGTCLAFVFSTYRILENSLTGFKKFATIAKGVLLYRVSMIIAQLAFYAVGVIEYGLILSAFISRTISSIFFKKKSQFALKKFRFKASTKIILENSNYSRDITIQNFLNTCSQYLPSLLLVLSYSNEEVGNYFFIIGVTQMPINIINSSLKKVLIKEYSENNSEKMNSLNRKVFKKLLLIGFPLILIAFLAGETIISFAFGNEWEIAGNLIPFVTLWMFAMALSTSFRMKYHACSEQKKLLKLEKILFFTRVACLLLCVSLKPKFELTIAIYCLIGLIINLVLIIKAPTKKLSL
ncbi:MAG: lipopolysaccharide biosynthesis protein [Flavobacteriaceae bacterium]|nr:lipopolysaccharide biosynthesis protein [Flavobacteriaceae bacterium]